MPANKKYKRYDKFKYKQTVVMVMYPHSNGYTCRIGCCELKTFQESELDALEKIQ